jgi:predicted metal-dependent peptidase
MVRVILGPLERLGADQRRAWAAARVWAAHQAPYMASALLALDPVVVDQSDEPESNRLDLGALPVDQQWHVYLDPDVLAEMTVPTIGFWLVHQVSHLLRHHAERSPVRVPAGRTTRPRTQSAGEQLWNAAADAEINDDLVAGNTARPEEAVTPSTLGLPDSLTAEQYWDALGGGGTDDGSGTDDGTHATEPGDRAAAAAGRGHDCGSGCDGAARPWDSGEPGLGASGQKLLERDVARRIEEHQRRYGTTPAGWRRWAEEILQPTVSWQRLLASAIRRGVADVAGRVDFSYRKPSRRSSLGGDVILPSLRQPLPKVAMVLDTSGSMNDHLLAQSLAEVDGVLRGLGVGRRHLQIVCCDAQAFEAQKIMRARDVELLGGGGTDMGAGLATAAALRPRPDLIVVLTDGHTPWPPQPPRGIRVIVGLMDPSGCVPEWARAIAIGTESVA